MRVLVVEDNGSLRAQLRDLLSDSNCEVDQARDGVEAIERFTRPPWPDVVLLDWMLPKVSGPEVLEELRRLGGGVPPVRVVVFSAFSLDDEIPGVAKVLRKPCKPADLVRAVMDVA